MDDDLNPLKHAKQNETRAQTAEQRAAQPRTPFYDRYGRSLSQALEASSSTDDDDMKHGPLGELLHDQGSPERNGLAAERRQSEHREEADPVLSEDEEASDGSGGAGGEVEVDSSSSSMTYSDDSSDELSFTGGCDDPQEFVRQVRKKTANRKSGTPLGLLGELIVRMDDQEEVEVLLGWKEAKVIAAAAGQLYLDADAGAAANPPRPQCTLAEVQAVFVERFPLTGAAEKADDTLKETKQNSSIKKHRPRFNRILVKAGLSVSILDVDIQNVVDRRVKKAFIETCCESIPKEILKKHGSVTEIKMPLRTN